MIEWEAVIGRVLAGESLDHRTAYEVMDDIMSGDMSPVRLAAFLAAMSAKGVEISELHGCADAMRDHALSIDLPRDAVDIVGTGGDGAHTTNISTTASIVIAAAGVPVVKHGNRAATSKSGSADMLEALGLDLDLSPKRIAEVFAEVGYAFLFANKFHPSMRHAGPVRRELGFPTVFNMLGPLTNPGRPRASAIGVAQEWQAPLMAGVLAGRGQDAIVLRGKEPALDEWSTVSVAQAWIVADGQVEGTEFDPCEVFGFRRASLDDLAGGDGAHNASIAREVLAGREGAVRDAVLLNAAAGLVAHGSLAGTRAEDGSFLERIGAALDIARRTIDSGAAAAHLERWVSVTRA